MIERRLDGRATAGSGPRVEHWHACRWSHHHLSDWLCKDTTGKSYLQIFSPDFCGKNTWFFLTFRNLTIVYIYQINREYLLTAVKIFTDSQFTVFFRRGIFFFSFFSTISNRRNVHRFTVHSLFLEGVYSFSLPVGCLSTEAESKLFL